VIPNHHQPPRSGEDAQTFEQDLPGANTAGFNTSYVSADVPLETSLTMNDSWGFNITDKEFKSVRTLVGYLVRAAGNGANLLRGGATVPVAETAAGVTLAVPPASAADPDRVVVVITSASPTPNRHGR